MIRYERVGEGGKLGLAVRGHATGHESPSGNVVCAAVSAVAETAVRGCAHYDGAIKAEDGAGLLAFRCRSTPETAAIITAALLQMQEIEKRYPECFEGSEYMCR